MVVVLWCGHTLTAHDTQSKGVVRNRRESDAQVGMLAGGGMLI